jgi:hypothetical protein
MISTANQILVGDKPFRPGGEEGLGWRGEPSARRALTPLFAVRNLLATARLVYPARDFLYHSGNADFRV